jgi:hypothetical protein
MDLCEGLVVDIGFCDASNATDIGSNLWVNGLLENLQSGTHCICKYPTRLPLLTDFFYEKIAWNYTKGSYPSQRTDLIALAYRLKLLI